MKRLLAILALVSALGFGAPALKADHGDGDEGHRHHHGKRFDHDDDRWERRDRYEYRSYDRDDRPRGWQRGRKTGWGNCGVPPGQAKKYGCRTYVYEGRRHYYYQDDDGRVVVRRPTIVLHGSVDVVK